MSGVILVPVAESDEVVEVPVDQLPEDESELTDLLKNESATLDLWLRFAVEYYRQGRYESFTKILEPIMALNEERAEDPTSGASSRLFEIFGTGPDVRKHFLEILNSLAAFHTVLGSRERDKTRKKAEFDKAKRYYDTAENIDLLEGAANVGRAVLQLARGELGRAEKTLTEVQDFHRNSVPALLGKACAKFNGGNFREALKLYRQVFSVNPSPPAVVRLGLGYCYNKLGQPRLARQALERTLELHEENVDAMVGLAVLHLNEERVEPALQMLKKAYELEPHNPAVLNHLANHYFYRGQYAKALSLAERANKHSDAKAIRAESCYHLARCHHAQSNYAMALQWYLESSKLHPDYAAPQFGLGQMHLENADDKKALACFERVLRFQPQNTDALKALGHLYRKEGRHADALAKLTLASEAAPADPSVWLELAQLQQRMPGQLAAALKAYEKAAGLLKKPPSTVPPELWNNIGGIRHRLGKLESAETAYNYAIKSATLVAGADGGEGAEYSAACVTTQFNLGRLYEERGEAERAAAKYKDILRHHPNYPGCFLRLADCTLASGDTLGAIGWAQKELTLHPKQPEALCTLANIYLANRDYKRAEATLLMCKDDTYAAGQRAWLLLRQAHAAAADKAGEPTAPLTAACTVAVSAEKGKAGSDKVDKAAEMFCKVLKEEPNNLYAANGLGVVCVAKGRLNEARSIFTQVREASPSCDTATCNLAQLSAAFGEHATATSLYESLSRKQEASGAAGASGGGNGGNGGGAAAAAAASSSIDALRLLMLRARSHFAAGKLGEARDCLAEAVGLSPDSHAAWHNLGLTLLTLARHPDGADAPPRPVAEVEAATANLGVASALLRALNPSLFGEAAGGEGAGGGADLGFSPADASKAASAECVKKGEEYGVTDERRHGLLRLCEALRSELADEGERAAEREKREAEEVAAADAKMKEYEMARQRVAEEAAAKKAAEEEAHKAALAEQKRRLEEKMLKWREADLREAEAAAAGERRKKKRREDEEEEANGVVSDDDADAAGAAGGGSDEEDADAAANLFGSDDDDDDADADGKTDAAAAGEDDEGGGGGGGGGEAPAKKKRLKRTAVAAEDGDAEADLFGDDDDDDAGAATAAAAGGSADAAEQPAPSSSQPAKRRKVIMDDDDDDE